ncbi:MAG: hypothetical protein NVS3B12_05470 [Acidimicrobiales bacterium]
MTRESAPGAAPAPAGATASVAWVSVRSLLRGFGKSCISVGVLILMFVAYQLWGTGFAEQRAQDRLRHQFATIGLPSRSPTTAPLTTAPPTEPPPTVGDGPTTTQTAPTPAPTGAPVPAMPAASEGAAIGLLRIPSIGVNVAVVEGVGVDDLKDGPGHYPRTPYPGQAGNAAIAGHRTTYGAPFYRLDELKTGDDLFVATKASSVPWHYKMVSAHDVDPSEVSVLNPTTDNILTLTTCTPRFTAAKRLIVVFKLIGAVDPQPSATPPDQHPTVGTLPASDTAPARPVGSLSGQGISTLPAIGWGLLCAALWFGAWLIGRGRKRRYLVYGLVLPVFLLALFFFFENFARFVPANI